MSLRTFFRRKTKALQELVEIMKQLGYPLGWWLKEYEEEAWLMQQYSQNLLVQEEFGDLKKYKLLRSVQKELRHI